MSDNRITYSRDECIDTLDMIIDRNNDNIFAIDQNMARSIKSLLVNDRKRIKEGPRFKRKYVMLKSACDSMYKHIKASSRTNKSKFKIWNKLYNEGWNDCINLMESAFKKYGIIDR